MGNTHISPGNRDLSLRFEISEGWTQRRGFHFQHHRSTLKPRSRSLEVNLSRLFQPLHQRHAKTIERAAFVTFVRLMTAWVPVTNTNQPPGSSHIEGYEVGCHWDCAAL